MCQTHSFTRFCTENKESYLKPRKCACISWAVIKLSPLCSIFTCLTHGKNFAHSIAVMQELHKNLSRGRGKNYHATCTTLWPRNHTECRIRLKRSLRCLEAASRIVEDNLWEMLPRRFPLSCSSCSQVLAVRLLNSCHHLAPHPCLRSHIRRSLLAGSPSCVAGFFLVSFAWPYVVRRWWRSRGKWPAASHGWFFVVPAQFL